jgi:hypothetical protein
MTRSKFSTKVVLLATGIGLSIAAFAGSQPAAAQSYSDEYTCPAGTVYDPTYGCTTAGADDFGYYDYPAGTVLYGRHGHGFGHVGIGAEGTIAHHGMGFGHSISGPHFGGDGFGHGMGGGFDHGVGFAHAGGFGHGMAGGFHGGGGGHR